MMLSMYIGDILIDYATPDFRFADTLKKREEVISDLRSFLYKTNFDKAYIAHRTPSFVLTVGSKVNEILEKQKIDEWLGNKIDENPLRLELMNEGHSFFRVEEIIKKL